MTEVANNDESAHNRWFWIYRDQSYIWSIKIKRIGVCNIHCRSPGINMNILQVIPYFVPAGKPVIATSLPGVMKEFGEDNGVLYVDRPEDAFSRAIQLIDNGCIEAEGRKARRFVEKHNWENIIDEFERVLEEVVENG